MRYLSLLLLLLFISAKTKSDFVKPSLKSKFFSVSKSSKIGWQSGMPGGRGGAGISYEFEIKMTKDFNGYFKMLWIGNKYYQIKFRNPEQIKDYNHFKKDDIIKIYAEEITSKNGMPFKSEEKNFTDPPFKYEGVALLEYSYGTKIYSVIIKSWTEKKQVDGI